MSKFIYRMESILSLKYKIEEQAKGEFAAARKRLDEEEERLSHLKGRKDDYEEKGRHLRENNLNVQDILENKYAISQMEEFILQQEVQVRIAENELENARLYLQEVMQERKAQEKLKEKAFEEFIKEENARESKEIDELVSYRFGQKRR